MATRISQQEQNAAQRYGAIRDDGDAAAVASPAHIAEPGHRERRASPAPSGKPLHPLAGFLRNRNSRRLRAVSLVAHVTPPLHSKHPATRYVGRRSSRS